MVLRTVCWAGHDEGRELKQEAEGEKVGGRFKEQRDGKLLSPLSFTRAVVVFPPVWGDVLPYQLEQSEKLSATPPASGYSPEGNPDENIRQTAWGWNRSSEQLGEAFPLFPPWSLGPRISHLLMSVILNLCAMRIFKHARPF